MKKTFFHFLSLIILISSFGCAQTPEKKSFTTKLSADEVDSAKFQEYFPLHYTSYQRNKEMSRTEYGGSEKESKYIREPQIPTLFRGFPFEINYFEDRGHPYAVEDVTTTKRITEKSPSACWTCKASEVPGLLKKEGVSFYNVPFLQRTGQIKHSIGCPDCHDPQNMNLRVNRQELIDALKVHGVDISKATRNEMRTYVCAQCHVEYYFEKGTRKVVFPWDKGFEPEEVYEYYKQIDFSDWIHKESQAPMLKVQHPEYEHWKTGTHGKAGVSCADCHMPYTKDKQGNKYTSHWITSPIKTMESSCSPCHRNQEISWLRERINNVQRRTFELQDAAADVLVEAHTAVYGAVRQEVYDTGKVKEAQELLRKAQWYWDWVAAENGRGFHNSAQALYILGQSINAANKVIITMQDKKNTTE